MLEEASGIISSYSRKLFLNRIGMPLIQLMFLTNNEENSKKIA